MQDYGDEVKDFFTVDKQLAAELEYDMRRYQEQLAEQQAPVRPVARGPARLPVPPHPGALPRWKVTASQWGREAGLFSGSADPDGAPLAAGSMTPQARAWAAAPLEAWTAPRALCQAVPGARA